MRDERVDDGVVDTVANGGGEVALRDGAAPGDVTGIGRLGAGKQLPAAGGQDAVREHEQIAAQVLPRGEAEIHAVRVLAEADERGALVIAAAAVGAEQRAVEAAP